MWWLGRSQHDSIQFIFCETQQLLSADVGPRRLSTVVSSTIHGTVLCWCVNLCKACIASVLCLGWWFCTDIVSVPTTVVFMWECCRAVPPHVFYGYSGCCFTWLAWRFHQELYLEQGCREQGFKIITHPSSCWGNRQKVAWLEWEQKGNKHS